jgi:hypothetical protein
MVSVFATGHCMQQFKTLPLFETSVLLVPKRNLRDFTLLNVDFKRRNCPSARYASAANIINRDTGVFKGRSALNNDLTDTEIVTKKILPLKQILLCN